MPVFTVGKTEIPYEIKESARAKRMRLTLRPDRVDVTVPKATDASLIESYLRQNERWLCDKWQQQAENPAFNPWPERFEPGAKVFFRGRWEPIVSKTTGQGPKIVVRFEKGLVIELPQDGAADYTIKSQIMKLELEPPS